MSAMSKATPTIQWQPTSDLHLEVLMGSAISMNYIAKFLGFANQSRFNHAFTRRGCDRSCDRTLFFNIYQEIGSRRFVKS
jgi:hypothetical protein